MKSPQLAFTNRMTEDIFFFVFSEFSGSRAVQRGSKLTRLMFNSKHVLTRSAKTYFTQDINSPGLRFMVTGLSIVLSRFIVMCVHWSEVERFPVELLLPDIFSYPIIYHEYYNSHKMRTIEFFSFVELLCEIALLLQLFNLRRRFTMLAQKGVKVANDFWMGNTCLDFKLN